MFRSEQARAYIAAEVRAAMGRAHVTSKSLSDEAKISTAALSRKINGKVGFTTDELLRVASVLKVDPATFLPHDERVAS